MQRTQLSIAGFEDEGRDAHRRLQAASKNWKREENIFSLEHSERNAALPIS